MKTIEIDDEVFAALEKRVRGFNETPNSIIRRLLERPETHAEPDPPAVIADGVNPFTPLVTSTTYLMANAGSRYLQILSFIHQIHGEGVFAQLTRHNFGGRVYFADNPDAIEKSGSSTNPRQIPGTKFYALTTLSNAAKRKLITDVLRLLKYSPTVIGHVIMTMPDSGIVKSTQFVYPTPNA